MAWHGLACQDIRQPPPRQLPSLKPIPPSVILSGLFRLARRYRLCQLFAPQIVEALQATSTLQVPQARRRVLSKVGQCPRCPLRPCGPTHSERGLTTVRFLHETFAFNPACRSHGSGADRLGGLWWPGQSVGGRRHRPQAQAACAQAHLAADGKRGAGPGLADRGHPGGGNGHARGGLCQRPRPPPLVVCAAQRRCAGGREQCTAQAARIDRPQRLDRRSDDETCRRGRAQRQPHQPAARCQRRRRGRGARSAAERVELAVRHGAGW